MRRAISATLASLVIATSAVATTASAEPYRFQRQDRFIGSYCDSHWRHADCRDWREHRHSWNEDRYNRW